MSPWLRLMTRIVPKSSERPQANSAYRPPSSVPWMTALTQFIETRRRRDPAARSRGGVAAHEPEVGLLDLLGGEVGRPALERGASLEEALHVRADAHRLADVLLDQQD